MSSLLKLILTVFIFSIAKQGDCAQQAKSIANYASNPVLSEPESASIQLPTQINLAAEDGWPPFADQYGKGVSHQLIQNAFNQVGIKVNSILVPHSRGVQMALDGNVDGVFNIAKLKQRQDTFIFGEQPLFISKSIFFQAKSKPIKASSPQQLTDKMRIGKIKGFYYGGNIDELTNIQFLEVSNQYQLINLLLTGKIDAALMYQEVAQKYIDQMGVGDEIEPAFDNQIIHVYLAFSRQQPYSQSLAKQLDLGLKKLIDNGTYQKIISGYAQPIAHSQK